eukprot:12953036-Ditylum_brightwellii.AAC.1
MDNCNKFNIHAALIAILEKIQTADNRTYVKSNVTNHIWKDLSDKPTSAEFSKAYNAQQEQMGNRPAKVQIDYEKEVNTSISNYAPPDNEIVTQWIKEYHREQS